MLFPVGRSALSPHGGLNLLYSITSSFDNALSPTPGAEPAAINYLATLGKTFPHVGG
ncbi:hypothetical protein IV41_GL000984 [Limosilactobacillus ingluviei]|uniref:Uncharacterized protein n=1 Tax=Limosilactobacillus ingluviei TaxID=148604 RepID=A0A0R2H388_9LACO|nr:hypothetical protein IV41_GL000984 [Limosilactobacillus ingluviei]